MHDHPVERPGIVARAPPVHPLADRDIRYSGIGEQPDLIRHNTLFLRRNAADRRRVLVPAIEVWRPSATRGTTVSRRGRRSGDECLSVHITRARDDEERKRKLYTQLRVVEVARNTPEIARRRAASRVARAHRAAEPAQACGPQGRGSARRAARRPRSRPPARDGVRQAFSLKDYGYRAYSYLARRAHRPPFFPSRPKASMRRTRSARCAARASSRPSIVERRGKKV